MSIHHAAATGFAKGAATYVKGRPDYPPEVEDWLRGDLALRKGKTVLDLGAGTGKFIPSLRATDAAIFAVEPVPAMLAQLVECNPGITAKEGSAEHIPLADNSIDAVVCAQSFHWFARREALAEIHRVLKPGGVLGLIWNVRDESVGWVAALTEIMRPYEGNTPRHHTQKWRQLFPAEGFGPLHEWRFPNAHTGSPEQVANAVVKAIEQNKVEISVAPIQQRLLAHFALASPGISVKVASGDSGQKAAAAVAKGQTDKR